MLIISLFPKCINLFFYDFPLYAYHKRHIDYKEVIDMKNETLDEMLERLTKECIEEKKGLLDTSTDGTEQFTEMVEKYQRKNHNDDER